MSQEAAALGTVPFRVLIDDAVKLSRRHFRALFWPVAVPVAVLQLVVLAGQGLWMSDLFGGTDPAALFSTDLLIFGCVAMLATALTLVAYAVLGFATVDAVAGRPPDAGLRWRFVASGRTLGTLALMYLAVLGGMLLCFFPGVWVLLLFGFTIPVLAEEGLAGTPALGRSAELARFNPRRRFADTPMVKLLLIYLVAFGLSYAVSFAVQLPFAVLQQVLLLRQMTEGGAAALPSWWLAIQAPSQLLSSLASTAITLYTGFCVALLYFDVRRRREGSDLEAAIAGLERGTSRGGEPKTP